MAAVPAEKAAAPAAGLVAEAAAPAAEAPAARAAAMAAAAAAPAVLEAAEEAAAVAVAEEAVAAARPEAEAEAEAEEAAAGSVAAEAAEAAAAAAGSHSPGRRDCRYCRCTDCHSPSNKDPPVEHQGAVVAVVFAAGWHFPAVHHYRCCRCRDCPFLLNTDHRAALIQSPCQHVWHPWPTNPTPRQGLWCRFRRVPYRQQAPGSQWLRLGQPAPMPTVRIPAGRWLRRRPHRTSPGLRSLPEVRTQEASMKCR
jgi:hypothetical protein